MLVVAMALKYGFSIDDLNNRLRSNPNYGFSSLTGSNPKAAKATYQWEHPKHGRLNLKKDDGEFWATLPRGRTLLLGALMYWLFQNASDILAWTEVYEE